MEGRKEGRNVVSEKIKERKIEGKKEGGMGRRKE